MKLGEEALVSCKAGYTMIGNSEKKPVTVYISLEDALVGVEDLIRSAEVTGVVLVSVPGFMFSLAMSAISFRSFVRSLKM